MEKGHIRRTNVQRKRCSCLFTTDRQASWSYLDHIERNGHTPKSIQLRDTWIQVLKKKIIERKSQKCDVVKPVVPMVEENFEAVFTAPKPEGGHCKRSELIALTLKAYYSEIHFPLPLKMIIIVIANIRRRCC